MNKFAKAMCMTAVVALAFTSCKKKEEQKSFLMNGKTEQFVEIYDEDGGERAYIDSDNNLQFEDQDGIVVFNYGSKHLYNTYKFDANSNYWNEQEPYAEGIDTKTDGYFYAFYPAENVSNVQLGAEHGQATFTLNNSQTYRTDGSGNVIMPKSAMYMAAKDEDASHNSFENMYLEFKNICGMLSMRFYSPTGKKITSIEIEDHRFNIVGDVTCNIDQINPTELTTWFTNYQDTDSYNQQLANYLNGIGYSVKNAGKTITLNCESPVELGRSKSKATRFLVVMRPLALLKGMTITIHFSNAEDVVIESVKDNRISPNVIRNMVIYNVG